MEDFMKPMFMYNFDEVKKACPHYKNSKCTYDEFEEDDCSIVICARKQAYYNNERNFLLKYEVDKLRKENKELKEGFDKVHISESPFVPYSPRLNCCNCSDSPGRRTAGSRRASRPGRRGRCARRCSSR